MDGWVWSNGGMMLTEENWSTGREALYSVGGRWMNEYGEMVEWHMLQRVTFTALERTQLSSVHKHHT